MPPYGYKSVDKLIASGWPEEMDDSSIHQPIWQSTPTLWTTAMQRRIWCQEKCEYSVKDIVDEARLKVTIKNSPALLNMEVLFDEVVALPETVLTVKVKTKAVWKEEDLVPTLEQLQREEELFGHLLKRAFFE